MILPVVLAVIMVVSILPDDARALHALVEAEELNKEKDCDDFDPHSQRSMAIQGRISRIRENAQVLSDAQVAPEAPSARPGDFRIPGGELGRIAPSVEIHETEIDVVDSDPTAPFSNGIPLVEVAKLDTSRDENAVIVVDSEPEVAERTANRGLEVCGGLLHEDLELVLQVVEAGEVEPPGVSPSGHIRLHVLADFQPHFPE
jgi:hypothetical protein